MDYEDRITIDTPEGVALELTLAGLGSRAIAGGIDILLKLALGTCELIVLVALFGDAGWLAIVPLAGLSFLAYNVAFEVLGGGRTPGKRWSGLRVVRASGRPVDFRASMIRSVARLVDGVALTYLPTMVSIVVTRRNQRPGDLMADTVVIRERRDADRAKPATVSVASAPADHGAAGATWDVSAVPAEDIATVRAFLERRDGLATDARARLAAQLDGALRPSVGGADEHDAERFLEILYDAKRARG
ncbi:MAG: hypothetical protein QOE31_1228 [Solirubrobacteraceae bacterium]|nr:hypothetical protein [Solirubrobacteraceae bacterium]